MSRSEPLGQIFLGNSPFVPSSFLIQILATFLLSETSTFIPTSPLVNLDAEGLIRLSHPPQEAPSLLLYCHQRTPPNPKQCLKGKALPQRKASFLATFIILAFFTLPFSSPRHRNLRCSRTPSLLVLHFYLKHVIQECSLSERAKLFALSYLVKVREEVTLLLRRKMGKATLISALLIGPSKPL